MRPLEGERRFASPDPLDDAPPFFSLLVADVVLLLRDPEHLELVLVPAAHDVHAEASATDVVGRGHLLGGDEGMMKGNVDRAEHVDASSRGQQARRPGDGLEAEGVGIRLATVALPAGDGHHGLDPNLVRQLREPEVVLPAGNPALGERRIGSPARAIGAEDRQPKPVGLHLVELGSLLGRYRVRNEVPAAGTAQGARSSRRNVRLIRSPVTSDWRGTPWT